jgi:putative oxidoreductase
MIAPGLLVLRLTLAVVLIAHGAHALFGFFAGPGIGPGGLSRLTAYFAALDLRLPFGLAVSHGTLQLVGGLLIAVGWLTRWVSVVVGSLLGFLLYVDAARWGFFLNVMQDPTRGQGVEFLMLEVGVLTALALTGAGDWSLDGWRASTAASRAAGRARLRHR